MKESEVKDVDHVAKEYYRYQYNTRNGLVNKDYMQDNYCMLLQERNYEVGLCYFSLIVNILIDVCNV